MNASQPASGRHPPQLGRLMPLAIAVLLLLAGAVAFSWSRSALPKSEQALMDARQALDDAHLRQQLADHNRAMLAAVDALQDKATGLGVLPEKWGEREINMQQQHLSRADANQMLLSVDRNRGQLFKPVAFDIGVTRMDDGLFTPPTGQIQPVLLTLRGELHFRLSERSL